MGELGHEEWSLHHSSGSLRRRDRGEFVSFLSAIHHVKTQQVFPVQARILRCWLISNFPASSTMRNNGLKKKNPGYGVLLEQAGLTNIDNLLKATSSPPTCLSMYYSHGPADCYHCFLGKLALVFQD